MSTALYRRYRPESFADVIGQEHVTGPLMTALDKNRVNHAYLFSGPRGCGKTTSARILARCLNCAQGPTSTPCGECESCRDLSRDGGGSLDVIEMDAASHGGVDHARDLRERASFAPVRDRYKIFIIDEAHMVTREGFNALLKIVEEPPPHIKFIFATTEPNKVLGTIRSRTHHYPFRLVPPETLHSYLSQLCVEENVKVAPGVLQLVVRAGGGSVRDSLSVLDQLMAGASADGITYDLAVSLLGFTHGELLDGMVQALAASDASAVFEAVNTAIQSGQDPRRFVEDLLERFRDLLMLQAVPDASQSVLRGLPEAQLRSMREQAEALSTADVTRAAEITSQALNDMNGSTSPQLTLELMCARIMLVTSTNSQALDARLDRLEQRLADGDFAAPTGSATGAGRATQASGMSQKAVNSQPHQQNSASVEHTSSQPERTQETVAQAPVAQAPAPLQSAPLAGLRRPAREQAPQNTAQQSQAPHSAPQRNQAEHTPQQSRPEQDVQQARPAQQASTNLVELVKTNWPEVLSQVPSPTGRHWLEQCTPSQYKDGQLFIRATMDVLKMVKPHIEELAQAIARVLEVQVRIRAEVEKGERQQPPARPQMQQGSTPQNVSQQRPQQNAPVADGPRGGEQAWAQHGQPRTDSVPQWSTDDWNNPVTSWDVAPIPSDHSQETQGSASRGTASQSVQSVENTPQENPPTQSYPQVSQLQNSQQSQPQSASFEDAYNSSGAAGSVSNSRSPQQAQSYPQDFRQNPAHNSDVVNQVARVAETEPESDSLHEDSAYKDSHPAAHNAPESHDVPSEKAASHSLSKQVEGEVEKLTPHVAATDSKDARESESTAEAPSSAGQNKVEQPSSETEDAVPFEQSERTENVALDVPIDYYDGPFDEPDDPYEDREYIAGQGYVDDAVAPPQQPHNVQSQQAPAESIAPNVPAFAKEHQGVGRPPLAQVQQSSEVHGERTELSVPAPLARESARKPYTANLSENNSEKSSTAPAMQNSPDQKLSFRERHAAQIAAGARSAYTQQNSAEDSAEPEEFVPSDEDTALEETVLIGQRAVEKILGGVVIDEQPLHGN